MEAVDFKMPIVVNQQIVTVANSNGSLVSDNNFVSFQELISGNRRLWRLQQNSAQFYSLVEINEEKPKTLPFARLSESENLADSAILDSEFIISPKEEADIDDSFLYGIQVIEHPRKVLFTQEVEINTKELKRWKPNIIIEPFLLEDDEQLV